MANKYNITAEETWPTRCPYSINHFSKYHTDSEDSHINGVAEEISTASPSRNSAVPGPSIEMPPSGRTTAMLGRMRGLIFGLVGRLFLLLIVRLVDDGCAVAWGGGVDIDDFIEISKKGREAGDFIVSQSQMHVLT